MSQSSQRFVLILMIISFAFYETNMIYIVDNKLIKYQLEASNIKCKVQQNFNENDDVDDDDDDVDYREE
jgi:hypothetical protein